MDEGFSTAPSSTAGLTSFPLLIEVAFTTENPLPQQLEFILSEPLPSNYDEKTMKEDGNFDKTEPAEIEIKSLNSVRDILKNKKNQFNNLCDSVLELDQIKGNSDIIKKNNLVFETEKLDTIDKNINTNLTCNDCYETFNSKEVYDIHMSGHANNMKCAICNMVLKSLKNYEKHCLRCKPYECQICGRIVRFRPNFIKHMRVHTGQQSERHKYKCDVCQKEFMSFEYFKVHKKIHNENVNLTCEVCGKVFSALASLRGHSKLHTGIKLHKCDICGKGFGQRYNLKIHSRVHTGEIPYECSICKKKLHTQSSYESHVKTHQKNQNFNESHSQKMSENKETKEISTFTNNNNNNNNNNFMLIIEKQKTEKETQKVVQNINEKLRSKCYMIPTTVSDVLPQSISNDEDIPFQNDEESPSIRNIIKCDTAALFKFNSISPKINEIVIKNNNVDVNDVIDDDAAINNIIFDNICTKYSATTSNKFQNYFTDEFINNIKSDSDDEGLITNSFTYSNAFDSSVLMANSINPDLYLSDFSHINNDYDDGFNRNLQSTILTTNTNNIIQTTTTDGNFIKKEWIFSNTLSDQDYSSISKSNESNNEDDDNGFYEAASFIYDD